MPSGTLGKKPVASVVAGVIGVPSIVTVALAIGRFSASRTWPETVCDGGGGGGR